MAREGILKCLLSLALFSCSTTSTEQEAEENRSSQVASSSSNQQVQNSSSSADSECTQTNTCLDTSKIDSITIPNAFQKPTQRFQFEEFNYEGAFRLSSEDFGASSVNYAIGTLAYNPANHSLFIAGHDHHRAIAEFPIVPGGHSEQVVDLPISETPLQNFVSLIDQLDNPNEVNRITGLLWHEGALIVNAENWYDAAGTNQQTTLYLANAADLNSSPKGFYEMEGAAQSAGYLGEIPKAWQGEFGASTYTGWSNVYSIVSRYSVGPSLWAFDPSKLAEQDLSLDPKIPAQAYMNYPFNGTHISANALDWAAQGEQGPFPPASPLWNQITDGVYGFFVPNRKTFAVIGSTGGLETGIGYKAIQEDGTQCGGPCPYNAMDQYNYYWLFDVEEILNAEDPSSIQPYSYGKWALPYDKQGQHKIIGATLDTQNEILYIALQDAGQVGDYDRPPLILSYSFNP